jgi:hypothetical protein
MLLALIDGEWMMVILLIAFPFKKSTGRGEAKQLWRCQGCNFLYYH